MTIAKFDWRRLLPRYWHQHFPTNRVWDRRLNALLDTCEVKLISRHTVRLGNATVWVANWPYAYGGLYQDDCPETGMPTVKTRLRLRRAVDVAVLDERT